MMVRFNQNLTLICVIFLSMTQFDTAFAASTGHKLTGLSQQEYQLVHWGRRIAQGTIAATEVAHAKGVFESTLQNGPIKSQIMSLEILEICGLPEWISLARPLLKHENTYIRLMAAYCLSTLSESRQDEDCIRAARGVMFEDAKDYYRDVRGYAMDDLMLELEKRYTLFRINPDGEAEHSEFLEAARAIIFWASPDEYIDSEIHRGIRKSGIEGPGWFDDDMVRTYQLLAKAGTGGAITLLAMSPFEGYLATEIKEEYAMCAAVYSGYDWERWAGLFYRGVTNISALEERRVYFEELRNAFILTKKKLWPTGLSNVILGEVSGQGKGVGPQRG